MKYRERADYGDGQEAGISGREADDKYFPVEVLAAIGAQIVFLADVENPLAGEDVRWDRIAIVRYPTRRSMIEMTMRPGFQKKHLHKQAGMEQTIVMLCEGDDCPVGPAMSSLADRLRSGSRPQAIKPPRVVMHLAHFTDAAAASSRVPASSGLRPEVNLAVVGTIIGDAREWSHLRMTRFEDARDLAEVSSEAGWTETATALADASVDRYAMVLKITLDWWAEA